MEELEQEFMRLYRNMGKIFGLSDLSLRIMALLYLEPKEVAMEELSGRTGYSLASISMAAKSLENLGIIQRKKKPGTNKVFFYMEKDILTINKNKLGKLREYLGPVKEELPKIIDKCTQKAKTKEEQEKLRIIQNYYKQVNQMERIMKRWIDELDALSRGGSS